MRSRTSKRRDVTKQLADIRARGFLPIVTAIAAKHFVTVEELVGDGAPACVMRARRELVAIWREEHRLSYPEIGRLLDRDHTTIMGACQPPGAPGVRKTTRELISLVDAAREELRVV